MSLILCAAAAPATAQTATVPPQPPFVRRTLTADMVRDLPSGANLFALLETTQADLVADRFNSSGLNVGEAPRLGGVNGSWSQTQYFIGDIDITSPSGGRPLLVPDVALWRRVQIGDGGRLPGSGRSGLSLSLEPRLPGERWQTTIEGAGAGGRLAGVSGPGDPPPIARLHHWSHFSGVVTGPLMPRRLRLVGGGQWTRNMKVIRDEPARLREEIRSGFAHVAVAPSRETELRALGLIQQITGPAVLSSPLDGGQQRRDRALHLQSSLARSGTQALRWQIFGGYTRQTRTTRRENTSSTIDEPTFLVDRLGDGPVPALLPEGNTSEYRSSVGARVVPAFGGQRHQLRFDGTADWMGARAEQPFSGVIGELVDGAPARLWSYSNPGLDSRRRASVVRVFAHDRIELSSAVTLDVSAGFEAIDGSARGAATAVAWRSWLPAAHLTWQAGTRAQLTFITGIRRAAHQLLFGLLAVGDPAAPVASVFRWDETGVEGQPLVARVGPGTGGDPDFSRIDPALKRPSADELALGLEARPRHGLRLSVMGLARREASLVNLVNVGVDLSGYSTSAVPDAGVDLVKPGDDQNLVIFNRRPESLGLDRFLLTNPGHDAVTTGVVLVTTEVATEKLWLLVGATASAVVGSAASRGFRPFENDQDALGELATNPNAATYARGRLFGDRAYTIKWTTIYRLPHEVRIGAIARYEDGQPFARLVVVPGLTQGTEAVRAFANGRSRFAFTGTLDVRAQKSFAIGPARLDAILDVYNVLGMRKEVEEYVVTGDRFRTPTAVQPPRAFHIGARVAF